MRESVLTFVRAALLRQLNIDRREFWAMIYSYPCHLTPDDDGGLVATFPDVPEAITGGSDRAEALSMAEDALATALAGYVHEKWDIPTPSDVADGQVSVAVPTVVAAKLAQYFAMKAQPYHQGGACRQAGEQRVRCAEVDQPRPPFPREPGPKGAPSGGAQPQGGVLPWSCPRPRLLQGNRGAGAECVAAGLGGGGECLYSARVGGGKVRVAADRCARVEVADEEPPIAVGLGLDTLGLDLVFEVLADLVQKDAVHDNDEKAGTIRSPNADVRVDHPRAVQPWLVSSQRERRKAGRSHDYHVRRRRASGLLSGTRITARR